MTSFTFTLAPKSLQPFRHLPLPSVLRPPTTDVFSQQKFASFLLRFTDITTPSLLSRLPLHYVIMIIAHRGLRKLNCLFRSCFLYPTSFSLCRLPIAHHSLQAWSPAAWTLDEIHPSCLRVCVCAGLDHFLSKNRKSVSQFPGTS